MITDLLGNIFQFIWKGEYDIIIQGNNCICKQKSGIAKQFVEIFQSDTFPMEKFPSINKLGMVDGLVFKRSNSGWNKTDVNILTKPEPGSIKVYNCYTQLYPRKEVNDITLPTYPYDMPVDYDAIRLVFRKLNLLHPGLRLITPWIGCGLAGGDRGIVRKIISEECTDISVSIVTYNKQ